MGWGKKSDDGTGNLLGKLNVLPWEREPLTEVQPLNKRAALPTELYDREPAKDARQLVAE